MVWKNNNKNDFEIDKLSVVKLVNCKGCSPSTINTEDGGIYLVRENLNNAVYNAKVMEQCAKMAFIGVTMANVIPTLIRGKINITISIMPK